MRKAIIVGAGTYGQVYAEYLKDIYDVVGFVDDNEKLIGNVVNGIKVLGNSDFLYQKKDKNFAIFVPIGNNEVRVAVLDKLASLGFEIPSFIHPQAVTHESVEIGNACYLLPDSNITPFAVLKDYVMVANGAYISHHTIIEKGCFISQCTNIGASIHIQENVYFGMGSIVMTGVKNVGKNALIGAGAVVIKDVPDNAIMAGVPAKILKYKENS
jgi:sugar O-acyltransferase (sialic acid O-acetyltransferase NeuD family)